MEPTIICVNNKNYYNADDLKEFDISYFAKTNKTIRSIIKNKNIPEKQYRYFCFNKKENIWKESDKDKPSPKAKLFIKEKWAKENIPKFNDEIKNEYEEAPPILELKEEEKFKDINNKPLNIEVRGERNIEKCYFDAKQVSQSLEIVKFQSNTVSESSSYEEGKHYKFFIKKSSCSTGKKSSKKIMYLTYWGLTKLLFGSKSSNCEHFQKWAINILFTHQLGKQEEKQILSNKLLGKSVKSAIDVFKTSCKSIPSIYLLTLGKVSELRKSFNIPKDIDDETVLCKYGKTENLERRLIEHNNDYGKIEGVELRLKYYAFIDPEFITDAENQIKNFFVANNMKLEHLERNELVLINANFMKNTLKTYELVHNACSGSVKEINCKIKDLEQQLEIKDLKHQNELKNKDLELKEKNFDIDKLKTELQHQNEIIKLKEQIYNLKNN